jgi:hypothetical protein
MHYHLYIVAFEAVLDCWTLYIFGRTAEWPGVHWRCVWSDFERFENLSHNAQRRDTIIRHGHRQLCNSLYVPRGTEIVGCGLNGCAKTRTTDRVPHAYYINPNIWRNSIRFFTYNRTITCNYNVINKNILICLISFNVMGTWVLKVGHVLHGTLFGTQQDIHVQSSSPNLLE